MSVAGWAIPWYRPEDWDRWQSICPDMALSYDEWLSRATAGFAEHQRLGHFPSKIVIDPREFQKWSRTHGGKVHAEARVKYAISILARERPNN